jgi:DNA-binding response OmpR family regulator
MRLPGQSGGEEEPGIVKPILIVEDDTDSRETLELVLRTEGYEVKGCASCQDAAELLLSVSAFEPSLILLDLGMARGMSGWEFLSLIKSKARLEEIPVVVVSGRNVDADTLRLHDVAAFLIKPADPAMLLTTARQLAPLGSC